MLTWTAKLLKEKKTAERVATKVEIVAILGAGGDTDGSEQ